MSSIIYVGEFPNGKNLKDSWFDGNDSTQKTTVNFKARKFKT